MFTLRTAAQRVRSVAPAGRCLVQLHTSAQARLFAYPDSKDPKQQRSLVDETIRAEAKRQWEELNLIPSESICFPESEKATGSVFGNIYAEGQADLRLARHSPPLAVDSTYFHAFHRRLSDGRYYRGCGEADRVELLARHYIAQAFSLLAGSPSADNIHVTVQALSGGPANLAIYQALMKPGDRILTLNLSHGGHLSHGSPFNVSGSVYKATHYTVDPVTQKLDYDQIRRLAHETKPQFIVGGASAYPYDWDWKKMREIADEVGAYLHADICHLAGLVVGGQLNNPLPYADIVMFTTHKTLMGPRGSAIVTKCAEIKRKIDTAVFPGMQGGPHMNSIAGIARLFEIIVQNRDDYCAFQRKVMENSKHLANAFKQQGFELGYGNDTGNHLLLIDLKKFKTINGTILDGETASRLLENVGIVVNKNTLPGDATAGDSSGLRFGIPWVTQRGITKEQIETLARVTKDVLYNSHGFQIWAPTGDEKCRARIPFDILQKAKSEIKELARSLPYPTFKIDQAEDNPFTQTKTVGDRSLILVHGEKSRLAINQLVSFTTHSLKEGQSGHGYMFTPEGKPIDFVSVTNIGRTLNAAYGPNGADRYVVSVKSSKLQHVVDWLNAASDGYVSVDTSDLFGKVDGPLAIDPYTGSAHMDEIVRAAASTKEPSNPASAVSADKPWFVGHKFLGRTGSPLPLFDWKPQDGPLKKTALHQWHSKNNGKMVPFGGWEMPVEYTDLGIFKEHAAVRKAAALFDVSHMSAVAFEGPNALPFIETVMANSAARLVDNEAQYSYMLREDGTALDDLYVYRLKHDKFYIVFNAGNFVRDFAWINAVNEGKVAIHAKDRHLKVDAPCKITELRTAGADAKVVVAFQGPLSMDILCELAQDDAQRATIRGGQLNDIHHVTIAGVPTMLARTGYTGETIGFELFVHPDKAVHVWETILAQGKERGVRVAGLGARDSTRIEAGFPLFGHELEGPESLSLTEADYGFVSRLHRPFYVGRDEYIERTEPRKKHLLRLHGQGRKSVREGHAIVDESGKAVGAVTSFAFSDDQYNFHVIAAVDASFRPKAGSSIVAARTTPDKVTGVPPESKSVTLKVLPRFPSAGEKAGWRKQY